MKSKQVAANRRRSDIRLVEEEMCMWEEERDAELWDQDSTCDDTSSGLPVFFYYLPPSVNFWEVQGAFID